MMKKKIEMAEKAKQDRELAAKLKKQADNDRKEVA